MMMMPNHNHNRNRIRSSPTATAKRGQNGVETQDFSTTASAPTARKSITTCDSHTL